MKKTRGLLACVIVLFLLVMFGLKVWLRPQKTILELPSKTLEMYQTLTPAMLESLYDLKVEQLKTGSSKETVKNLESYQSVESIDATETVDVYLYSDSDIYHATLYFKDSTPPILLVNGLESPEGELTLKHDQILGDILNLEGYDVRGDKKIQLDVTSSHDLTKTYTEDFDFVAQTGDGNHDITSHIKVHVLKEEVAQGSQSMPTISNDEAERIDVLVNKNFILNASYVPLLSEFPAKYAVSEGYRAHPEALDAYLEMVDALYAETGLWMYVTSSYRDYEFQGRLYQNSVASMGLEKASMLSAKPGASEHQTGLAIDVVTEGVSMYDFGTTQQSKWVNNNAHRFGFIVRYQENFVDQTGYNAEPWHLRYLGKDLAQKVYESGLSYEKYRGL